MPKKSLAETNPELAKQWHPTLNGDLTPSDFTPGSGKKVWWKCPKGDDHEWESSISHRAKGSGCSICYGSKVVKSNSLATLNPEIAKIWHPTKNGELTPHNIKSKSNKKIWWKCKKGDDHEWMATPSNVSKGYKNGCPMCSGSKFSVTNSLLNVNPKLSKQWHPINNGKLTPIEVKFNSGKKVWWKCDKANDHVWIASISHRNNGSGCPICSGRKVVLSNCLETLNPELAKEWHPTKNGDLTPYKVSLNSGKRVWWKCPKGDDHEWKASLNSRSDGIGCPYCTLTPQSKQELTITFELIKLFKNIDPKGLKTRLDGKLRAIDIFIPKFNLCVEFDGHYWHKEKEEIDKIKSEMLFDKGFKVIRVREEPLPKTHDNDVISKQPYNGKQVTNDILSMIMSIFELDAKLVSKIKEYQSKEGLQNEKGLDRYIDKILTEKAEKK